MAKRRTSKQVENIFFKYVENNVRRVNRDTAIHMMMCEFDLSKEHAQIMFDAFDTDKNEQMSMWEFEHFYNTVGQSAKECVEKFHEMDTDGNGTLDMEEARAGLKAMRTANGGQFKDKEIDFFLKTAAGDDGLLNIANFSGMLYRLKVYGQAPKKDEKK